MLELEPAATPCRVGRCAARDSHEPQAAKKIRFYKVLKCQCFYTI